MVIFTLIIDSLDLVVFDIPLEGVIALELVFYIPLIWGDSAPSASDSHKHNASYVTSLTFFSSDGSFFVLWLYFGRLTSDVITGVAITQMC